MTRIDPQDGSGIIYLLDGRDVVALLEDDVIDSFTVEPDVPDGWEEVAVLARHHDIMNLGL